MIRWSTRQKPVKEYDMEHSLQRETVRRKNKIILLRSDEVSLTNSSFKDKSTEAGLDEAEPTTPYSPYTENGNEY